MPNDDLSYRGQRLNLSVFKWSGVPVKPRHLNLRRAETQPVQPITQRDLDGPQVVKGWVFEGWGFVPAISRRLETEDRSLPVWFGSDERLTGHPGRNLPPPPPR